jgi:hypothetical protein
VIDGKATSARPPVNAAVVPRSERSVVAPAGRRQSRHDLLLVFATALVLLATAMVGKAVLAGPPPLPAAAPAATAPPAPTPERAVVEATREVYVNRIREVTPPVCETPLPGATCVTDIPPCTPVLRQQPGLLCRWPGEPRRQTAT